MSAVTTSLDDFAPHRRWNLVWRYTRSFEYDEVEEMVLLDSQHQRCSSISSDRPFRPLGAVRGTDGLYHLNDPQSGLLCVFGAFSKPAVDTLRLPHVENHRKWFDELKVRLPRPRTTRSAHSSQPSDVVYQWYFSTTDDVISPWSVANGFRCRVGSANGRWPGSLNHTELGSIRRILLDSFGEACQCCGSWPATVIDHDHVTGKVRGLVCVGCNMTVDDCCHVSGCKYSDYLNDTPASTIGLDVLHPNRSRDRKHLASRIEKIGFDPFPNQLEMGKLEVIEGIGN
ncbi:MAG: hypothetical protein ACJA07_001965 [Rhodococcus sp. (in: high G+C Gram-positive bacteria)]|jgi:hypothetical protein